MTATLACYEDQTHADGTAILVVPAAWVLKHTERSATCALAKPTGRSDFRIR